ncbi:MAG: hypothetical protein AB9883_07480 [Acidaminococcaceae bacterium]
MMDLKLISRASQPFYGSRFTQASASGIKLLDSRGLNFSRATDLSPGVDDFKDLAPFNTYKIIVQPDGNGISQKVAEEGTSAFDTHVANREGDVITYFPEGWYKRWQEPDGADTSIFTPKRYAGFYKGGDFGITSYPLGDDGAGGVQSMPGLPLKVNASWDNYNALTRAKGLRVMDYASACYVTLLGSVKYNSLNWQSVIGSGISNTYSGEGTTTAEKAVVGETGVNRIVIPNATAAKFSVGCRATLTAVTFSQRLVTAITVYDANNMAIALDGAVFTTVAGTTGIRRAVEGTGGTDSVLGSCGMPTGTDGKTSVKTLNIENFYSNAWNIVGGAFRYNGTDFYYNPDVTNVNAWPATIEAAIAAGWKKMNGSLPVGEGYAKRLNCDRSLPWLTAPMTVGGTSVSPVGDYFYTNASTDMRLVLHAGALSSGSNGGPYCLNLNNTLAAASWYCAAFGLWKRPV